VKKSEGTVQNVPAQSLDNHLFSVILISTVKDGPELEGINPGR